MILPLLLVVQLSVASGEVVDRVAGTVNGDVVTLSDLRDRAGEEYERAERLAPGKGRDEAVSAALRRAFDEIVAEKLLAQQAKDLQLEVTDKQVDSAIQDVKMRNKFDDAQFDEALAAQGLDRPKFRQQIRRELETYQVLQYKVRGRVKITDEDVRNYYQSHPQEFGGEEEIHVRHIFLPLPPDAAAADEAKVRAQGEKVLKRLRDGEGFAKVAREVSKGPAAEEGGDLGFLRRGAIQKQLEDAAFALADGQVSGLVRAGPGLHILKVEARRKGGGKGYDEAREEIRGRLMEEQVGTYRKQYLDELKKEALIEAKIPELRG